MLVTPILMFFFPEEVVLPNQSLKSYILMLLVLSQNADVLSVP